MPTSSSLLFFLEPSNGLRINGVSRVLHALDCHYLHNGWRDGNGLKLDSREMVKESIMNHKQPNFDTDGLVWAVTSSGDTELGVLLGTGGDPYAPNFLRIDLAFVPELSFFRQLIPLVSPVEAFYSFREAQRSLRKVIHSSGTKLLARRALRAVHFLSNPYIDKLGIRIAIGNLSVKLHEVEDGVILDFAGDVQKYVDDGDVRLQVEAMFALNIISALPKE